MHLLTFSTGYGQRLTAERRFVENGRRTQQATIDRYHLPQPYQQCLMRLDLLNGDLA
ncbi:hypothetical protein D3C81_2017840 [compost metagenome]